VIASGLEWVSLRPNEYASNFLGLWAAQLRSGNVIRAPYGDSQQAPIDECDLAAVAVEALLTDRLLGQKVPLTGPRSQSARELADTLAQALGLPIRFEERCWAKASPKASSPGTCCCKPRRYSGPLRSPTPSRRSWAVQPPILLPGLLTTPSRSGGWPREARPARRHRWRRPRGPQPGRCCRSPGYGRGAEPGKAARTRRRRTARPGQSKQRGSRRRATRRRGGDLHGRP
jgi:hypothetical protein